MQLIHEPSIEEAAEFLAEASKVFQEALDREYIRRRKNLVNAGMSKRTAILLPSLQEDVKSIIRLGKFTDEQLKMIHALFAVWIPPRVVPESRIPANY